MIVEKPITKYVIYNLVVCFAVYWLSNLILWYPWSINETLGKVLMLTINPVIWGYTSYMCISRYPKTNILHATILNSLLFILEAIISDLIFFGLIRNAMDEIMQFTTIYGWCFVIVLPFVVYGLLTKNIEKRRKQLTNSDFISPLLTGISSFIIIFLILLFDIRFE